MLHDLRMPCASLLLVTALVGCNKSEPPPVTAPEGVVQTAPAPPPPPALPAFRFPEVGEEIWINCSGTFIDGIDTFDGKPRPATVQVQLTNEPPEVNFGRRFAMGPMIETKGSGVDGAPEYIVGLTDPADDISEKLVSDTRWEITSTAVERRRSPATTKEHVVLDRESGQFELHSNYLDPSYSKSITSFIGKCHGETPAESQPRELEAARMRESGLGHEPEFNSRVAVVAKLSFKAGAQCQGMRNQLLQFAREQFIREDQWEAYLERITGTSVQIGCL